MAGLPAKTWPSSLSCMLGHKNEAAHHDCCCDGFPQAGRQVRDLGLQDAHVFLLAVHGADGRPHCRQVAREGAPGVGREQHGPGVAVALPDLQVQTPVVPDRLLGSQLICTTHKERSAHKNQVLCGVLVLGRVWMGLVGEESREERLKASALPLHTFRCRGLWSLTGYLAPQLI